MPTMNIKGRELHYLDEGEGFPVLWGHSFLWNSQMWAPQIEVFSSRFRCIVPDLWSHGQSGHLNATEYTLKQLADDYWQLMQNLGLNEVIVIGLSVGGMWGTQLTLDHPEAVRALVLMDTYVGAEPEETQKKYLGMLSMMESNHGVPEDLANIIAPIFLSPKTVKNRPVMVEQLKDDLMRIPAVAIPGVATLGKMIFTRPDLLPQLSKIQQPTLIVVGEDDIPRPPKEAKIMAESMPDSRLRIIPDAGHIANLEQMEVVTQVLDNFLDTVLSVALKI